MEVNGFAHRWEELDEDITVPGILELKPFDGMRYARPTRIRSNGRFPRAIGIIGPLKGSMDCHIEPDWLLIYRTDDKSRSGAHWTS